MVRRDMEQMVCTGVNTVRTYTAPPRWFMDLAAEHALMVVAGLAWEGRQCLFDDRRWRDRVAAAVRREVQALAGHPALLMVCIGNEIPPLVARWHGTKRLERFLRRLRDVVKGVDPQALVTYACYPPAEFLDLAFLDVIGFNIYLEQESDFRDYLGRLQLLAGDRPLLLTELGLDSRRNGAERQAETLAWQLAAAAEKGTAGTLVYAWTDEWAVAGVPVEDWDFGLLDRERRPKPALEAVSWHYRQSRYDLWELNHGEWPRVSVVCCAYNAAATLAETLASLDGLNYPDYETIVIDDGSTDATAEIARRHRCRLIQVPNGGLSRARNLGIQAATGRIVAFIDADAAADPDWLYFLVSQLENCAAAGCGGPNLSPPSDSEIAQRVDRAPGNPVHVLLDNERAEHLPGCNMAFWKDALLRVGGFNPLYRAAGDDVDVCWKILEQGGTLAFSPAAVVWHHRRPDRKAYLRQQQGYGRAEALLEARYPERYRMLGGASWRGRVYEGPQPGPTGWAGRAGRVRHGPQGGGLFQSLYARQPPWWLSLAAAPQWHGVTASFAATAAWLAWEGRTFWILAAAMAAMGMLASVTCCVDTALRACARDELRGAARWRRVAGVAQFHFLQPWTRWLARVREDWRSGTERAWPRRGRGRLWCGWDRRAEWLAELRRLLEAAGLEVEEGDEWGAWDLRARSYPGYRARLESVLERQSEITFRLRVETPLSLNLLEAGLIAVLVETAVAWPHCPALLPLLLPLVCAFAGLRKERRRVLAAVVRLAARAGEVSGMVPIGELASLRARERDPELRGAAGGAAAREGLRC